MIVGCPKETKNHEYRVGLTPTGAHALAAAGHRVLVECQAGARIGYADAAYRQAGAVLVDDAAAVYGEAELIVKVKELQPAEYPLARSGQILFCYHHFAPAPDLLAAMLASGATCLAYETVADPVGGLPLLAPMSRIAGRLAPQAGAWALQTANGGSIDQGGISAASRPTSHTDPLFEAEGVLHYCVPNMPSAVARTATQALTLATLPHVLALAELGLDRALDRDPGLAAGLQVRSGRITLESLARDTALPR